MSTAQTHVARSLIIVHRIMNQRPHRSVTLGSEHTSFGRKLTSGPGAVHQLRIEGLLINWVKNPLDRFVLQTSYAALNASRVFGP